MTVEEKLAKSLTAETTELIPFLPYLLQDLFELGSSPNDMIALISRHIKTDQDTRVLDLACGKGAVSIAVAKAFGCHVKGVDLMEAFIETAFERAMAENVDGRCQFEVGDINESVLSEDGYDLVILDAVGEVLGNQGETLQKLKRTIKSGGYALIDDGYEKVATDSPYLTRDEWLKTISDNGFELVEELPIGDSDLAEVVEEQKSVLTQRVNELKVKYPDRSELFDGYLKSQFDECDALENDIVGVTMLLKKIE